MKIKTVPVNSISQDPANLRKHGERNIDAIVASLRKFGQQHPIVIDSKGIILSGNGRYMAAVKLGWHEIEAVESDLTGSSATAYAIADNRTAELAEWDTTALAETLRALQSEEFDTDAAGYSESEIDALVEGLGSELLAGDKEIIEDTIPEPPVDPITKAGDLWILGEHRLLCGDSTNADDVARLMGGVKAQLVITDPPYGVSYADKNAFLNAIDKGNRNQTKIENDHLNKKETQAIWGSAFKNMADVMGPGAVVYCFMPQGGDQMMMMMMMMEGGIEPRHELIWLKNNHVLGRSDYNYKHEPILYAWKKGGHKFYGDFSTSVIECKRPQSSKLHPTMKPVELVATLAQNSSQISDTIYDPFLGSGTTLIAAEQLNRKCFGMEISPQYCDVIVKRWENLTGMVGVRETPLPPVGI